MHNIWINSIRSNIRISVFQMILLDSSGSMSGTSFELAITTIGAILDTLSDDDFVNVVVFSDTTRSAVPCFRDKLVRLFNTLSTFELLMY